MATLNVFSSFQEVIQCLTSYESKIRSGEINELFELYEKVKSKYTIFPAKRKLFIVFEGLDGSGKSTMTKMANKKLGGVHIATPPPCIQHLRTFFDTCEPRLRRAYYSLGNYMAALEIASVLGSQHIIMDRYWNSTACYGLAESAADIPPKGHPIYRWPNDLLKPDLIIFLNVEETERLRRTARRVATPEEDKLKENAEYRARLYTAYTRMDDLMIFESNKPPKAEVAAIIEECINPILNHF